MLRLAGCAAASRFVRCISTVGCVLSSRQAFCPDTVLSRLQMHQPYQPLLLRPLGCTGLFRVNQPFVASCGFGADDLRQRPLFEWIHDDDRAHFEVAAGASLAGQPMTQAIVARHQCKDGSWLPLQWQFELHDGELFANGLAVHDSEPPVARRAHHSDDGSSLAETLDSMARIVEMKNPGMLCSILLVDEAGEHIVGGAAPSLPAVYNKAVEGLRIGPGVGSCGTAAFWNMPVVVEDIANDPLWQDLLPAAKLAGVASCWSNPVVASDGRVLGAMALYDTKPRAPERYQMDGLGIAAKMVGLAVERDRLEHQLRRTEKMEALGLLAGGIAHDFNNLLAAIVGNSELLAAKLPRGSEMAEMVDDVLSAGQSAAELCRQVLAYAGRGHSSRELIHCNALTREVGSLVRVVKGKDTELRFALSDTECCVAGDAAQIQSLILNLLTNASDAIGDDEGCITVSTRVRKYTSSELQQLGVESPIDGGEFVEIEVVDTGCGIEPLTLSRIFDPFFSTKSAKRGLGLAAAQGIVASHKGAITLSSEVGVGTTFTVFLPYVSVGAVPDLARSVEPMVPAGLRVLIADDERVVRNTIARTLRDAGIEVLVAIDGKQAVSMFRQHQQTIDCVLLDYRMPKMTGGEAMREIRSIAKHAKVLLTSGYAEQGLLEQFRGDGVTAVLQKPTPRQDLIAAICAAATSRVTSA